MKTLVSVLVLLLGLTVFDAYRQSDSTNTNRQEKAITLHIEGMACQLCAQSLKNSLDKLEGSIIHEIDPQNKFAKLSFRSNKVPADDRLKEAVENAGFKLKKIARKEKNNPNNRATHNHSVNPVSHSSQPPDACALGVCPKQHT